MPAGRTEPVTSGQTAGGRLAGNVLSGPLAQMLSSFGVASLADRDAVTETVERELSARGHAARVVRLQYETLHLEAPAQAARFLRYDVDELLQALALSVPGEVSRIVVRVAA